MREAPLLTIIVPTFNRSAHLGNVLRSISQQLANGRSKVNLVIGNNASTDDTRQVIQGFVELHPDTLVIHHESNLGADENFCRCIEQVVTPYFWLVGDDDLLVNGVINKVNEILAAKNPDLLYAHSEWVNEIVFDKHFGSLDGATPRSHTRINFARHVNVWVTYISGMVVNLRRLREIDNNLDIRKYKGTSLVQLGWVLPLINAGSRFVSLDVPCVVATSGNTGGYSLVQVFSINFERIVRDVFGEKSPLAKVILNYNSWVFLPSMLLIYRFKNLGTFEDGDLSKSLRHRSGLISYWLLVKPILTLPRIPAQLVFVGARVTRLLLISWKYLSAHSNEMLSGMSNVYELLKNVLHKMTCRLRGLAMRPFVGETRGPLHIGSSCRIIGRRNIVFLGPFTANHRNRIEVIDDLGGVNHGATIIFGANVSMEDDCHIGAAHRIELHDNVMLASKVYISDHSHGNTTKEDMQIPPRLRHIESKGPVIIEENVWVGEGVSILSGVRIGRGSIIGANAVVTSDIPPFSVAAGCPARIIKSVA